MFGVSWPDVRRTLLVAVEQDSDPYAVMIPTAEIIRFYYAPSRRLAQALFWGEYSEMFNAERSGIFEEGVVRVHLRRWLEDQDAWTLARYLSSPVMQREAARLYQSLQLDQLNCTSLIAEPDHALPCGFPFEGPTTSRHSCPFARERVRWALSISKSALRIENRLTAVCHSSSSTDTRSVAEAACFYLLAALGLLGVAIATHTVAVVRITPLKKANRFPDRFLQNFTHTTLSGIQTDR
jgi:hypothetical protein